VSYSGEDFARDTGVSRETLAQIQLWHELLIKWNRRINLVSPAAMGDFWKRHALDSWQLTPHIPDDVETAIDMGSGAGFPGVAMGIYFKSCGKGHIKLVESAGKKANFLKTVVRELDLPVSVSSERVESLTPEPVDLITARAFAPLDRMLAYAKPFWGSQTVGLFLKGEGVQGEIEAAAQNWTFQHTVSDSASDPSGKILAIRNLSQVGK